MNYTDANNYDCVQIHFSMDTAENYTANKSCLKFIEVVGGVETVHGEQTLPFGGTVHGPGGYRSGAMLTIKACRWLTKFGVEIHAHEAGGNPVTPFCYENGDYANATSDKAGLGSDAYASAKFSFFFNFALYKHVSTHLECSACCPEEEGPPGECPCLKVVLAGIVAAAPEDCICCDLLNTTYYLKAVPADVPTWFLLLTGSGDCGHVNITATIEEAASGHTLVVRLGDHEWELALSGDDLYGGLYGALPECTTWNDLELANVASGTECDSSSSTATVSNQIDTAKCREQELPCAQCWNSALPASFEVVIPSGTWAANRGCNPPYVNCGDLPDPSEGEGTFLLERTGPCTYGYNRPRIGEDHLDFQCCDDFGIILSLGRTLVTGQLRLRVIASFGSCCWQRSCDGAHGGIWINDELDAYTCDALLDCRFDGDTVSVPFDYEWTLPYSGHTFMCFRIGSENTLTAKAVA